MTDINEYKKRAEEIKKFNYVADSKDLANAVIELCQRVEELESYVENEALKRNNKEISGFNINSAKQVSELSHEQKVQLAAIP